MSKNKDRYDPISLGDSGTIESGPKSGGKTPGNGEWWVVKDAQGNVETSGQDRVTKDAPHEYTVTRHTRVEGKPEVVEELKINTQTLKAEKSTKVGKSRK